MTEIRRGEPEPDNTLRHGNPDVQQTDVTGGELGSVKQELHAATQKLNLTKQELFDTKAKVVETRQEVNETKQKLVETKKKLEETERKLNETVWKLQIGKQTSMSSLETLDPTLLSYFFHVRRYLDQKGSAAMLIFIQSAGVAQVRKQARDPPWL